MHATQLTLLHFMWSFLYLQMSELAHLRTLGYSSIIAEISAAGSLAAWEPGQFDPKKDWERMLWAWLKETVAAGKISTPIYLGYGNKDSFLPAHQLLAQILPADHVRKIPGGHDPETMVQLWNLFLDCPALD